MLDFGGDGLVWHYGLWGRDTKNHDEAQDRSNRTLAQGCELGPGQRDAPETPAEDLLTGDEREMIEAFVERRQLRPPGERGQPLGTDIRSWVVLLARMVGWRPSKRQPLPGNEVLWRAYVRLQTMVLGMQTLRGP